MANEDNKGFYIGDLVTGKVVTGQAAVQFRELRKTRNGDPFLTVTLSDRTGRITARDFENAAANEKVFEPGCVVKVRAKVEEYRNEPQLVIEKARKCTADEYQLADFVPATTQDVDAMFGCLRSSVDAMKNEWLRALLGLVLDRHGDALRRAPGAMRIHHAFAGGLLEHVVSMCGAARALCSHYPRLDRDLMVAGCILHDLGKTRELEIGVAIEHSAEGKLIGHIAQGLLMLEDCCRSIEGFPGELALTLRHIVVSHHGSYDFGALKLPMTPEAIALSFLDDLDAKLQIAYRLIDEAGENEFSSYERAIEREMWLGPKKS